MNQNSWKAISVPNPLQVVGMKVLERPLEKLDDVRKKKLIELIGIESSAPAAGAPG